jgi:hypothetical protein
MDETLYDTSWTVYAIPTLTTSISRLIQPHSTSSEAQQEHQIRLSAHADRFRLSLGKDRPRYEREEEQEQLGGLTRCTWNNLTTRDSSRKGTKRKRDTDDAEAGTLHGLKISLFYEKKTYNFILYASPSSVASGQKIPNSSTSTVLLAKSSSSVLKRFFSYLDDTFSISQSYPLKIPSSVLQQTLENHVTTITSIFDIGLPEIQRDDAMTSALGTIKVTLSFSAPVAPGLKTLDIAIPANTVLTMCKTACEDRDVRRESHGKYCLEYLANEIHQKTGLKLPLSGVDDGQVLPAIESVKELPIRISRISTASYALSSDSRVKLAAKSVNQVNSGCDNDRDNDDKNPANIIRRANQNLLNVVLEEARRQVQACG